MKFLIIGALILAVVLFTPIPYYQQYELPCASCPPSGPCPACPGVGLHFGPSLWQKLTNRSTTYSTTQVNQTPLPSPDEIANWKTYTDQSLGYSIKYPDQIGGEKAYLFGPTKGFLSNIGKLPISDTTPRDIYINNEDNQKNLSLEQYVKTLSTDSQIKMESFKVGGLDGIKVTGLPAADFTVNVFISHNNKIFSFMLDPLTTNGTDQDKIWENTFYKILSTFTFLDQSSDLKIYNGQGFSLQYPSNVVPGGEPGVIGSKLRLDTSTQKLSDLDAPQGYTYDNLKNDPRELQKGNYGAEVGWVDAKSEKLVSLGKINAKEFVTLEAFEVCDVEFTRSLIFYVDDRINFVTLVAPADPIIKSMPSYFKLDPESCGPDQKVWAEGKPVVFYLSLLNNKGSAPAQLWFDTFDQIVKSIKIN